MVAVPPETAEEVKDADGKIQRRGGQNIYGGWMRRKLKEAGSEDFKWSVFYLALARAVASSKRTMSGSEGRYAPQQRRYDNGEFMCRLTVSGTHADSGYSRPEIVDLLRRDRQPSARPSSRRRMV
jgi:hypothetical protein